MATVFFHIEIEEDCLRDEVDNPPEDIAEQLESQTVRYASELFGAKVSTSGRRHDGALICSFKTDSLDRVRAIIRENQLVEGNDQIVSGAEYVIIRDFQTY